MAEKKKVDQAGPADDKKKALETAISQIEKSYGKGSIMRYGENQHISVDTIPTGSLSLDLALGIGGVPKGRIIEIYGPESSGKTTLALHIIASAQKRGGEVAFIDVEHALEPAYARALGVDIESLLISSQIRERMRWPLRRRSCARVLSMSLSLTPLQHLSHVVKSRVRWVTAVSAL